MPPNDFLQQPPTPQRAFDFEHEVEQQLREAGRQTVEQTYNAAEAEPAESLPARVRIGGQEYRRNRKTPRPVATLFGKIRLRRCIYQSSEASQEGIAPLEHQLGIVAGVTTPAAACQSGPGHCFPSVNHDAILEAIVAPILVAIAGGSIPGGAKCCQSKRRPTRRQSVTSRKTPPFFSGIPPSPWRGNT